MEKLVANAHLAVVNSKFRTSHTWTNKFTSSGVFWYKRVRLRVWIFDMVKWPRLHLKRPIMWQWWLHSSASQVDPYVDNVFSQTQSFFFSVSFFFLFKYFLLNLFIIFLQFSQKRGNCFNCYLKTIHGLYLFMQLKRVKCGSIIQSSSASFSAFILCWEMIVWKINNSVQHNIVTN